MTPAQHLPSVAFSRTARYRAQGGRFRGHSEPPPASQMALESPLAEFPALPLFTDAYMADTDHLTDAEHGRYLKLLILLWRTPGQRIPNDDGWLARKFRRSVEDVQKEIRPLVDEFCQTDGNWISQKRLSREFSYLRKQSKKQSDRAKKRWDNEIPSSPGNATPGNAPTPTPTPSITEEANASSDSIELFHGPNGSPRPAPLAADLTAGFEAWYATYPRHVGKGAAAKAFRNARKRGASIEVLTDGARRYAEARAGQDPQFTAHPATWLNQDRFLDQADPQCPLGASNGTGFGNANRPASPHEGLFAAAAQAARDRRNA